MYSKKSSSHVISFQIISTTNGKILEVYGPFMGSKFNSDQYCLDMMSNENFISDHADNHEKMIKKLRLKKGGKSVH